MHKSVLRRMPARAASPGGRLAAWLGALGLLAALLLGVPSLPVLAQAGSAAAAPEELADLPLLSSLSLGGKGNTWSLAVGDVNADGYLDLVTGGGFLDTPGPLQVYLNDGSGNLDRPGLTRWLGDVLQASLALADLDGDGMLDLIAGQYQGQGLVFMNDGRGGFVEARTLGGPAPTTGIAAGDLDGNGALDVVLVRDCSAAGTEPCESSRIYLNDGQGNLQPPEGTGSLDGEQTAGAVALGDMDADGDLDVIVGDAQAGVRLYVNDGQGGLTAESRELDAGGGTTGLAVGDLNGDGRLDLVQAGHTADVVYLNDGLGFFEAGQPLPDKYYFDVVAVDLADLNGDGVLDIVAGAGNSEALEQDLVFLNDGSGGFGKPLAFGSDNSTSSVKVADFNGDGVLDLVTGNYQEAEVWVYFREAQGVFSAASDFSPAATARRAVLGDVDGNGALDVLMVGGADQPHTIYLNDGRCLAAKTCATYQFDASPGARAVALADMDGDGRLDAIEVGQGPHHLYLNQGAPTFFSSAKSVVFGRPAEDGNSVLAADLNGDEHLDVVVGNTEQSYVYINDALGQGRLGRAGAGRALGTGTEAVYGLAAGDLDLDGDVDIVAGAGRRAAREGRRYVAGEKNRIFLNDGNGYFGEPRSFGRDDDTAAVALADLNADRALDIVVINDYSDRSLVYLNDGTGEFGAGSPFGSFRSRHSVVVGDLDGDGDFDLVVGLRGGAEVYLNDGSSLFEDPLLVYKDVQSATTGLALGDLDNDGAPDLVMARGSLSAQPSRVYLNRSQAGRGLPNSAPRIAPGHPRSSTIAGSTFSAGVLDDRYVTIPYTLFDDEADPVGAVVARYSLDGGGHWSAALPRVGTSNTPLQTSADGTPHEFVWDTLASGVFGQSDAVVVRFEVYAQPSAAGQPGAFRYTHQVPALAQQPFAAAVTAPFRLRGTQVRVVDEDGEALPGALVYRLPGGQSSGAEAMPQARRPLPTNERGFVPGRGVLAGQDHLVAMLPMTATLPVSFTNQVHYYLTSARPITEGLAMQTVSETGVIELIVPTDPAGEVHPLLLFDLTVSTEWDASEDELFRLQLEEGFRRASELLYDVTDGQVALGRVDVLPAKSYWNRADVLVYATNSMRPSAAIGGVTRIALAEKVRPEYGQDPTRQVARAYVPGQVRMGTAWDPFGEDTGDLGEQWWRALAHELSHYLLFLPDNYIGLKPADPNDPEGKRFLSQIDCPGSFMTTTRDPSYSEFLSETQWEGICEQSLAEQTTGRADWQTVVARYPMLRAPKNTLEGPVVQPLDITRLVMWRLPVARPSLAARYFELREEGGQRQRMRLPNAQVYLFQKQGTDDPSDDVLVSLGSPTGGGDRIKVRGASPGDRLCLFDFSDPARTYAGCIDDLSAANVSIPVARLDAVAESSRWAPAIDVRAATTMTLEIEVRQPLPRGTLLKAQVFPAHYPSAPGIAPVVTLVGAGDGRYATSVRLPYPAADVSVHVWVDDDSQREAVSQFYLQLPWKPSDPIVAGPDVPFVAGGDKAAIAGGDKAAIAGGDKAAIAGGDKAAIAGGDKPAIAGGDKPAIGGGDKPAIAGGDKPAIAGGDKPAIAGGDKPAIAGGDKAAIAGGDKAAIAGGDKAAIAGGDKAAIAAADRPPLASAPNYAFAAPTLSADSQVVIYDQRGLFEPSGIQSLQVLAAAPELDDEPWLVPVGQVYRVQPDDAVKSARSIAFTYLQRDVPDGYEHTLAIYFLAADAGSWKRLETTQFVENMVVADLQPGGGVYGVMSTVALPALQPGWNAFAYPLAGTRPISSALASLAGRYSVVYEPAAGSEALTAWLQASRPGEGQPGGAWLTARTSLYIRSGPGVQARAIGFLRRGESARVIGADQATGWRQIECPTGLEGSAACWVTGNARWVSLEERAPQSATPDDILSGLKTNVTSLQFGHVYWIKIEGEGEATIYLAPPRRGPDGIVPGSH